ncbi:hypothetical protein B0J12DRAFT_636022, partial [Macrophomina phaseolina]
MMDIPKVLSPSAGENQTARARAIAISCIVIVFVTLILRTLGRYCLKLKHGFKDTSPLQITRFLGMDDVFNLLAVGIYMCAIFYNATLGMVKLSVLSLYRRILAGVPSRRLPIINWIAFIIVSVNTCVNVFLAAFQCRPVAAAFDSSIKGTCINQAAFYLGNASSGIFTDIMVYGLSIPIVKPLQMDPRKKLQTLLTLLLGALAIVTSCIRISFLPALLKTSDTTWATSVPMAWSIAEPTIGILVSSMPAMRTIRYLWSHEIKQRRSRHSNPCSEGHIQL